MTDAEVLDNVFSTARRLLLREVFYGNVLMNMNKGVSSANPTAWVSPNGLSINLRVNPEFWSNLNEDTRLGTIKHEVLHVCFGHLSTFWGAMSREDRDVANIAMDIAINQYIKKEELIEGACTLEYFNEKLELSMLPEQGCRYYFDELMKSSQTSKFKALMKAMMANAQQNNESDPGFDNKEEQTPNNAGEVKKEGVNGEKKSEPNKGQSKRPYPGAPIMPSHDFSDETTGESANENGEHSDILGNFINGMLKQVAQLCPPGTEPGELSMIIKKLFEKKKQVIDWKQYFRNFVTSAISSEISQTWRKVNKRFECNKGFKLLTNVRLLACIDTSGSVSDYTLAAFIRELAHIKKAGAKIDVLQFDHEIQSVSEFDEKKDMHIHGRGGTSFQPPMDYYKLHRRDYDCCVFLTDGESYKPTSFNTAKLLWLIYNMCEEGIKEGTKNFPGRKVYISKEEDGAC